MLDFIFRYFENLSFQEICRKFFSKPSRGLLRIKSYFL